MRYAQKKRMLVSAWQLGAGSAMEEALVREGAILRLPEGDYALFSQEAVNGTGQRARAGDYFKVDTLGGRHYPYPNRREDFQAAHRHIRGDVYEQVSPPVPVWLAGDGPCGEMDFLLSTGRLVLRPEDGERYFNASLWDAPLSASRDAAVVFYRVDRDGRGRVTDALFNFVGRREFERDYVLLPEEGPLPLS